jgi:hypothetical protein
MCDFIARTNWSNIESNYFVDTIIIFDRSFYTNVPITVTFVKQAMLCCAFSFVSPENYPHKSGAIFHIDLHVFNIPTEISNSTNELNHVKRLPIFQNKSFQIPYRRMNHFAITGISVCSPLFKTPFATIVLNGFLSLIKGLSSKNRLPFPSFFWGLGVTNNAAKPNCIVPTGDNGSSYEGNSSVELIVIKTNETQLSWKQQLYHKFEHRQSHFDFLNNAYWVSLS